jgi:hypothetical protein
MGCSKKPWIASKKPSRNCKEKKVFTAENAKNAEYMRFKNPRIKCLSVNQLPLPWREGTEGRGERKLGGGEKACALFTSLPDRTFQSCANYAEKQFFCRLLKNVQIQGARNPEE